MSKHKADPSKWSSGYIHIYPNGHLVNKDKSLDESFMTVGVPYILISLLLLYIIETEQRSRAKVKVKVKVP